LPRQSLARPRVALALAVAQGRASKTIIA